MPNTIKIKDNKNTKVSKELFMQCVDKHCLSTELVKKEWHGVDVLVKPLLSLAEVLQFVNNVTEACFLEETGEYIPEIKDFAINANVLAFYTNIELPDDTSEKYEYIMRCDLYETIVDVIDKIQFNNILVAIDKKIAHIASASIQSLQQEILNLYGIVNNMEEQFSNLFSTINEDDVSKMLSAIIDDGLDEEKLMQAYINSKSKDISQE